MPLHYLAKFAFLLFLPCVFGNAAIQLQNPGITLETSVREEILDKAAFVEWEAGETRPPQGRDAERGPAWVMWTSDPRTRVGHSGLKFGESKVPGPRHLRVGFTEAIPVGSVMARGNVRVSALSAGAAYPGVFTLEDQWIPGQRLEGREVTGGQTVSDAISLWVFPEGTTTRSLRFTHVADPADPSYEGWLGGAVVLPGRFTNLAPLSVAASGSDNQHAPMLTNGLQDGWGTWQNLSLDSVTLDQQAVISEGNPEWVMLSWAEPVELDGLAAVWCGFGSATVQAYDGPESRHPRDASDADWRTVGEYAGFECGYPATFWPNTFKFGKTIKTRAVRLLITGVTPANHPHVQRRPAGGKRVWLGELVALHNLGSSPIVPPEVAEVGVNGLHPPVPVQFHLPEAGYVTLVIEDGTGKRVRNLVSETWFPAGDNTAWWDGTHDLDRDLDAAKHGLYVIPAHFVEPGKYTARGLWRKELKAFYEFPAYGPGNPPWPLPDHTGGWLANHSAPSAAVFVPGAFSPTGEPSVFLGSFVTEGPDGFAWVDLDGTKRGGMKWIGGNWTAAPHLGRDMGPKAPAYISAYTASLWETDKKSGVIELRINALEKSDGNKLKAREVAKFVLDDEPSEALEQRLEAVGGVSAFNGTVTCPLKFSNRVLLIDPASGKVGRTLRVEDPRGLSYDPAGHLSVLSGKRLLRFKAGEPEPYVVVGEGLEDPFGVTLDSAGNLYISDHGNSHQVKVFTYEGKFLRAIGHPGRPKAGAYDPLHMNHPAGLAVDSQGQLWVTEHDFLPKRVSVWTTGGKFVRAVYGPAKYGGGGQLDTGDHSRFLYADESKGTLEFELDWEKGTSVPKAVLFRNSEKGLVLPHRTGAPETAFPLNGRRFLTNCYNSNPVAGANNVFLFVEEGGVAKPFAGMGVANDWPLLQETAFHPRWPEGSDPLGEKWRNNKVNMAMYLWMDTNGDAQVQPTEINMVQTPSQGFTVMPDLSFCVANAGDKALRFRPASFGHDGIPVYNLSTREVLAEGVQGPKSSGGAQMLADASDEAIITLGVEPFHSHSICGVKAGRTTWSYPNLWPGLHASHHAAKPDRPGELIGPTRLMGGFFQPKGSQVGPLFALNANMGNFYIFTRDGLFVATVFADSRLGKPWKMARAQRGMGLDGLTLHDENFWPSINQAPDGKVYAVDGSNTCLLRLEGLETLRAIPGSTLEVTTGDLQASQAYVDEREAARQKAFGSGILTAALLQVSKKVDGDLADWVGAGWVEIDKRGDGANFNSNSKPYEVLGAIAADSTHLFAAWSTRDKKLPDNSGELPNALFKTGGGLDLMIGLDPKADPNRKLPVPGDLRLLVSCVEGQPKALLYRAVVPGTENGSKIPFTSPVWSLTFDQVQDVSDQVRLAANGEGHFEISIPLQVLGLTPAPGLKLRGDIGVLRGDGSRTTARTYWSNKATAITADVPSEAKLSPSLWGTFEWK